MKIDDFKTADLAYLTASVPVPELKSFFDEGQEPVFRIRGLSASEFWRCMEEMAANHADSNRRLVSAVQGMDIKLIKDAFTDYLNDRIDSVPNEIVKRRNMILYGVMEPRLDMESIIRIDQFFPEVFFRLSERIKELTGGSPSQAETLYANPRVQNAIAMCAERGLDGSIIGMKKGLYEVIPDIFPYGYLSESEMAVWSIAVSKSGKK